MVMVTDFLSPAWECYYSKEAIYMETTYPGSREADIARNIFSRTHNCIENVYFIPFTVKMVLFTGP